MPRVKKDAEKETVKSTSSLMPESVLNRGGDKKSASYLPWVLIVLVIIGALSLVLFQQERTKSLQEELTQLKQNPQKIAEDETKMLVEKVGQLIELPNEEPAIATVTDPSTLKDQPFFANAQVDDRVLIYSIAKKAYLYRPSTNKVIEVAPVSLDGGATNSNTNTNTKASTNSNSNIEKPTNSNKNSNTVNTTNNTNTTNANTKN